MIDFQWASELQDAIVIKLDAMWTWDQYFAMQKEVSAMIESVADKQVDCIFLLPKNQILPSNPLGNLRKVVNQTHPRYGMSIIVGANAFTVLMLNTLFKVIGYQKIHFVATLVDAHTYIETLRQKACSSI